MKKIIFLSDWHVPFEDKKTLKTVLNFVYQQKPDTIVLGGDLLDFYDVSSFSKNPERLQSLQTELDICKKYLRELRQKLPKTRIIYLEGNHEKRLVRYLQQHPELFSLRQLRVPKLLDLKTLRIEYQNEFMFCNFLFKHGEFITIHTAKKEYTHEGCGGCSGHSHKVECHHHTDRFKTHSWYGAGHLCDEAQALYGSTRKDWQQGFAVLHFEISSKKVYVEPILIDQKTHRFLYGGKLYG